MQIEIGTFKITKDDKTIELTANEAKELYKKLNEHFGIIMNWGSGSSFKVATNGEASNGEAQTTAFEFSGTKTSQS